MSCPAAARRGGDRSAWCGVSPVERCSGRRQFRRLTAVAIARPMPRSIASCSPACGSTRVRRSTTSVGSRRARPGAKSSVASSAMRPGRSSTWSDSYSQDPAHRGCDTAEPLGNIPAHACTTGRARFVLMDLLAENALSKAVFETALSRGCAQARQPALRTRDLQPRISHLSFPAPLC